MPHYNQHPTERVRRITNDTLYSHMQERLATIPDTAVGYSMHRMLMSQNTNKITKKNTTIGKCPNQPCRKLQLNFSLYQLYSNLQHVREIEINLYPLYNKFPKMQYLLQIHQKSEYYQQKHSCVHILKFIHQSNFS